MELGSAVHGIYWLCANLADLGPVLLSVDDLHWADEPSLLFLTYLARRASELPLVICATTRPAESEPMRRHLTALRAQSIDVLAPETLSDDGVTRVIADVFTAEADPEFIAACAKTSGGNPFLLVEMLTALRSDGAEPSADQAGRWTSCDRRHSTARCWHASRASALRRTRRHRRGDPWGPTPSSATSRD